jgi:hypothetical protein
MEIKYEGDDGYNSSSNRIVFYDKAGRIKIQEVLSTLGYEINASKHRQLVIKDKGCNEHLNKLLNILCEHFDIVIESRRPVYQNVRCNNYLIDCMIPELKPGNIFL